MRSAVAHGLAILAMLPVMFLVFALVLNGGRLSSEAYGFALIYMMFSGPVVLGATLIYYAVFRAHRLAILALAVMSIGTLIGLQFRLFGDTQDFWALAFLAGNASALVHHAVIRLMRGWTAMEQPAAGL